MTLLADDTVDLSHYAYSIYLGSGIYSAADRNVTTFNIPLDYEIIPLREGAWGLQLKIPFAIGIYNFTDLPIDAPIADRVATFTLLPGIELSRQVTERWRLAPFIDLGVGKNLTNENTTLVYGLGLKSHFAYPWKTFNFELENRFLYAGNKARNTQLSDDFRAIESIVTASHDLPYEIDQRPLVASLYLGNYLYSNLAFLRFNQKEFKVRVQYEIGVTLALKKPAKLWIVDNPLLGIGYRFGDELSAIRLVFSAPF